MKSSRILQTIFGCLCAGQVAHSALLVRDDLPRCPPCHTVTRTIVPPCVPPIQPCTGPASPTVACTKTANVWPAPPEEASYSPPCPTTTVYAGCPTIPPCNEVNCDVVTVTHTSEKPPQCTCSADDEHPVETISECPMFKCLAPTRSCGAGEDPKAMKSWTRTLEVHDCTTTTFVGLTSCSVCPSCTGTPPPVATPPPIAHPPALPTMD